MQRIDTNASGHRSGVRIQCFQNWRFLVDCSEGEMVGPSKKVLLLELNEINWRVIDRLIEQRGKAFLPNFEKLRTEGAWAVQSAVERSPLLDPWITWVTLHTGVSPAVHGASVLEQSSDSISAPRTWHYAAEAGRKVGVFGSISSYPPPPVHGFVVPGPFAPGNETHPPRLAPVQAVNRRYTQVHNKTTRAPTLAENAGTAAALIGMGLSLGTMAHVATQLVRERLQSGQRWRRVCLQPRLNFDIFAALYRKERPDFATWHSNHAAHFMHHYWRAWDDAVFPVKSSPKERKDYGEAVPEGYRLCDELIGRAMQLLAPDTVLVVASSMGQQPYISDVYRAGKVIVRVRDMDALLAVVGREGISEVVPTMVPQWNLRVEDPVRRLAVKTAFETAYRVRGEDQAEQREASFVVQETESILTVTPLGLTQDGRDWRYCFPQAAGADPTGYPIESLMAIDAPTVKQGMHHIDGLLAFYGAGVRSGVRLPDCTNLDVAPTLLALMDVPVPAVMEGQVLGCTEAFAARARLAAQAKPAPLPIAA
ncbi:alkaline phosphatase family protein [uncultured Sphaerotilus sp.]|uniref:alkaline phosphatase family protein n=1 Tax=uncultured Sphaerotilus sp. TaxID=474984 RepID=UPI0030CA2F9D